jgi:hypothetical protein
MGIIINSSELINLFLIIPILSPLFSDYTYEAGTRVAFRNAVFGGIILGCIQLVEVGLTKY